MGPTTAVISALALGPLHLSQPTLAAGVGTSRSCHERTRALQQNYSITPRGDALEFPDTLHDDDRDIVFLRELLEAGDGGIIVCIDLAPAV